HRGTRCVTGLSAQVEAILFSSNRPLKVRELQQATDSGRDDVEHALDELRSVLDGRGVMLMRHQDELHLATRPEFAAAVRRALRPEVSGKLSTAAYETLAIVAYNQPVARSRIEEVRGVNCESVLTNLELRDVITVDGRAVKPATQHRYLMLNKPLGVITTAKDEAGRTSVLDVLGEGASGHRVFPVGRLDADSTGLLLITDDGEVAYRLTHP